MRQIAMVNLGLLVLVGVAGCGAPGGFSVPKGAQLRAEASPAGKGNFSSFTINERGRLYIYDADNARLLYSGTVEPNNTVRLYPDGAAIVPSSTAARPINEQDMTSQRIAQWESGQRVRAYVLPIVQPEQNPNQKR